MSAGDCFKALHERLGCYGCRWADTSCLGLSGCCANEQAWDLPEDGPCPVREGVLPHTVAAALARGGK